MKTSKKNKGLTPTEYTNLIKACPDFTLLFYRDIENNLYKPKTTEVANLGQFKKWKKIQNAEIEKLQKEEAARRAKEEAKYKASHKGNKHSNCECWDMVAIAKYKDGTTVKITGKSASSPTVLKKEGLLWVSGQGKEKPGLHKYKNDLTCCSNAYFSKYVQIAHATPIGMTKSPKYKGVTHGSDRSFPMSEYDYWIGLTSTPNNYGWDFANGLGKYRVNKKREAEVRTVFGKLKPLKLGLGKMEMNIDGVNCPSKTRYYKVE
jgi:hypothetical protein